MIRIMATYWELEFHIYYLIFCLVADFQRTMNLFSYSSVLIWCLNTILINDSLFLNVMKIILKTSIFVKRQSWCRSSSQFRLVVLCYTTIPSTSNTLKNLLAHSNYHSFYTTQEFNTKKGQMSTIFNTYVTPKIKEINHPAILQKWKLNIDAAD